MGVSGISAELEGGPTAGWIQGLDGGEEGDQHRVWERECGVFFIVPWMALECGCLSGYLWHLTLPLKALRAFSTLDVWYEAWDLGPLDLCWSDVMDVYAT